ncbi:hypothetical protein LINPERPRIM_LOCUS43655 [Linum perenne]
MCGEVKGLELASAEEHGQIFLQMDSWTSILLLTSEADTDHQHGMETLRFRELQNWDWDDHNYREGNCTIDFLAGLGYGYPFGSHVVSVTDCNLAYFLRYDYFGITTPRRV